MKLKTVFTAIFSFIIAFVAQGQSIDETYRFAEKQFLAGNYETALIEYQRVAFFDAEGKYNSVYQKIGESFYAENQFDEAARNFDIAARVAENDSLQAEMYFKKAMCFFKQHNYFFALNELLGLQPPKSSYFQQKHDLYTAIALFGIEEYETAYNHLSKIVDEESLPELTGIFNHFEKIRKRFRPEKVQTMSTIFPGIGQFYVGNIGSGLNSLVLIGGIGVITIYIWQSYGFLDAVLSMSSWYYRYYSGGIKNANSLALEKIAREREITYQEIIQLVEENISDTE
ncbi:hypothetical protein SAMN05444280_12367 [Tangfeifania diversioriginum]|uniref:Uncharacterized protein n=1 Tax=Tangfeifania diversioriginum TaxID=1168035 RepID=A0A1M6KJ21_9BACT|nr:hypothetical protein [Tangfeifania diversioriginum]SHJ58954.1 hypothetical protein SAMN05444280_12367 [Tangfeifania diversioriginum]